MEKAEVQSIAHSLGDSIFGRGLAAIASARSQPRLALIIAHGLAELVVSTLVERRCKHGKKINNDHRGYPQSAKLVLLHELNVLSDHHFRLLNWFRDLRNDSAHEPFFELKSDHLQNFTLPEQRDLTKFTDLMGLLILDLIVEFREDVADVFLKGLPIAITVTHVGAEPRKYLIPLKSDTDS